MKKELKKKNKEYQNVLLYVTSEATTNNWCTDWGENGGSGTIRVGDTGTQRCN